MILLVATTGGTARANQAIDDPARMNLAAGQLVRMQLPSGLFPYDYNFETGATESMGDMTGPNIVRQAVVSFALSEYLLAFDTPSLRRTIIKVLQAFEDRSLRIGKGVIQSALENSGLYNQWRIWKTWRKPLNTLGLLYSSEGDGAVVSANGSYERAWSGATALALIAELRYRAATGDNRFAKARARWLRGLLVLQVPGRGFREAPHYLTETGYVNGEAWLALAEYSRAFPNDDRIKRHLAELDDYLMERYRAQPMVQFYHWGTMASAVRAETTGNPRFRAFIHDQTAWIAANQKQVLDDQGNSCAWIEGLATAYPILKAADEKTNQLASTVREWITILMQRNRAMQILPGQTRGLKTQSDKLRKNVGAFMVSSAAAQTQIDATGHCLSALMIMERAGLSISQP